MIIKTAIALLLCTSLFLIGFLINGNLNMYFNLSGLLVVIGGTFTAALLSFKWNKLVIAAKVVAASYNRPLRTEREIVEILVNLSVKSRMEGIISLEKEEDIASSMFLRRALGCLVDGYRADQIQSILTTEMQYFKMRRNEIERVVQGVAEYFPTFGIIGSVVGLITMLSGINDTNIVLQAVPIALTSTLYGLIFSNFVFQPFAANVREHTNNELLLQKIIAEGVLAIESEMNPIILQTRLDSFLTPSERIDDYVSIARIKEKFRIQENEPATEEKGYDVEHVVHPILAKALTE